MKKLYAFFSKLPQRFRSLFRAAKRFLGRVFSNPESKSGSQAKDAFGRAIQEIIDKATHQARIAGRKGLPVTDLLAQCECELIQLKDEKLQEVDRIAQNNTERINQIDVHLSNSAKSRANSIEQREQERLTNDLSKAESAYKEALHFLHTCKQDLVKAEENLDGIQERFGSHPPSRKSVRWKMFFSVLSGLLDYALSFQAFEDARLNVGVSAIAALVIAGGISYTSFYTGKTRITAPSNMKYFLIGGLIIQGALFIFRIYFGNQEWFANTIYSVLILIFFAVGAVSAKLLTEEKAKLEALDLVTQLRTQLKRALGEVELKETILKRVPNDFNSCCLNQAESEVNSLIEEKESLSMGLSDVTAEKQIIADRITHGINLSKASIQVAYNQGKSNFFN